MFGLNIYKDVAIEINYRRTKYVDLYVKDPSSTVYFFSLRYCPWKYAPDIKGHSSQQILGKAQITE